MNVARLLLLVLGLLVSGCATRQLPTPAAATLSAAALTEAQARVERRETLLREAGGVTFSGRVAMANGSQGGNGRVEWSQRGNSYQVVLSAPVTRQSWSLSSGPDGARIEGLEGGLREGPDAGQLLLEATRMEVPVGALAAWAAGARADAREFGPAQLDFSAAGTLVRLEQGGWTIEYQDWQPAGGGHEVSWPRRLSAQRGQARVRLVVDTWTLAPGGGD